MTRISRFGAIVVLYFVTWTIVLLVLFAASYAGAHEYRPDYIDLERHANWKAMRSHNCFWYGRNCPGQRRWRHYHRPAVTYSNGESDAYCHRLIEATGDQAQSRDNAENLALRTWQGRVRFHFGEKYIDFGNARDKKITCSPSSVADTVGGKIQDKLLGISHFRCELSARPCRAPARRVNKDAED